MKYDTVMDGLDEVYECVKKNKDSANFSVFEVREFLKDRYSQLAHTWINGMDIPQIQRLMNTIEKLSYTDWRVDYNKCESTIKDILYRGYKEQLEVSDV